jgi:hypothetical protein
VYFEHFHDYYRHHPHGAPIFTILVVVLVIAVVFSLLRSGKS